MITSLNEFIICPNCGSAEYLENYPVPGTSICAKCAHEITKIKLKEVLEDDIYLQNCPFCGKEGEEGDTLFEEDHVIVYKCKGCGKLIGYRIALYPIYDPTKEFDENAFSGKAVAIAKKEGKSILSASKYAEIAKALKEKEKNPKEKCKKQLHGLLREKTESLKAMGVTEQTLIRAFNEAQSYIEDKGVLTEKQLLLLICGSITYAENVQFRRREINERYATERALAELFNVDRKTIRKWKNLLLEGDKSPKWGVYIYQENGSLESDTIEIPKDIKAVVKLEKSYKGRCCILGRNSDLIWRIKYTNGGWSDICQSIYETFKKTYWEYEGALNLP